MNRFSRQAARSILFHALWASLLVVPAFGRTQEAHWEDVFSLTHPDEALRNDARTRLLGSGPDGFRILLLATRTLGDQTLPVLALHMHCPRAAFAGLPMLNPWIGFLAAEILAERMTASPAEATQLARSAVPLERMMGLLGLTAEPRSLSAALDDLVHETDPGVLDFTRRLLPCAIKRAQDDPEAAQSLALASRWLVGLRDEILPPTRCEDASFSAGAVLEALLSGSARANSWRRAGEDLRVMVTLEGGVEVALSSRCALSLYDDAVGHQRFLPGLIMPFAESTVIEPRLRQEALRRAERDLLRYPAQELNALAARLVLAGGPSEHLVTFNADSPFAQERLLEAAARQGQPAAWRAIEQATLCRGDFGHIERIALLGYVSTREAASTAAEIAKHCPQARGAATAALIRLGDRRATDTLADALADPKLGQDALERVIEEHATSWLVTSLRQIAAGEGRAADQAGRILAGLRDNGRIR